MISAPMSSQLRAPSTQGAATEEHPVTEELARIKTYMGKLKELGQGAAKEQQRLKVRLCTFMSKQAHCWRYDSTMVA